jgi:hypothetical protein
MTDPTGPEDVARRVAAKLVDIDADLPAAVNQALAADPLQPPPGRLIDPISLASLIVGIAALGWTIYHDLKRDTVTAKLDRAGTAERLTARLQNESDAVADFPARLTGTQRLRIIHVIATEILADGGR